MCEKVEKRTSLMQAQLEDGDILCFQRVLTPVRICGDYVQQHLLGGVVMPECKCL